MSRGRRRKLIDKIPASNSAAVVNSLDWQDFELLVGQAFRMQGYAVTETGQAGLTEGSIWYSRRGENERSCSASIGEFRRSCGHRP